MKALLNWIFGKKAELPKGETYQEGEERRRKLWAKWEAERIAEAESFKTLIKPPEVAKYHRIPEGDYPHESDEVWVSAHSQDSGQRSNDLNGFIVLSDLREFLAAASYVRMGYMEEIKGGCEFPVGSEAIKLARRAK